MRTMTMCILLLLPLCALVYAGIPNTCDNTIIFSNGQIDMHANGIYFCAPVGDTPRIFMARNKLLLYLKCDNSRWSGLEYKKLNSGEETEFTTSVYYKLTASCVEPLYCSAQPGSGVRISPSKRDLVLKISNGYEWIRTTIVENMNQAECTDQTHALFNDHGQVTNNLVKCDRRGWYDDENPLPFADNSKQQNFECRPAIPKPCNIINSASSREIWPAQEDNIKSYYQCRQDGNYSKKFMIESNQYLTLHCDESGVYGMPGLRKIADAYSILTVSCVEYCVANAGEGVILLHYWSDYSLGGSGFAPREYINQAQCHDQTYTLFHNGNQVMNNIAWCDSRGWFNPAQQSFSENSKPQNFECKLVNRPFPMPPIPSNPFPIDFPTPCYNIKGVSFDQMSNYKYEDTRYVPAVDFYCKLEGKTSKIFVTGSIQYWYLRCDYSGWHGMPYNKLSSGEQLLSVADANTILNASCVEYCVAKADESVRISLDNMKKILILKYGINTLEDNVGENINQVECNDPTHGLFHNGEQVDNNIAKCDLRGWYNPDNQKPFAENTKPQHFECRSATVNPGPFPIPPIPSIPTIPSIPPIPSIPTIPSIPPIPSIPTIPPTGTIPTSPPIPSMPTMPTMPTMQTMPTKPTMPTASDSVAEAQSPVVAICASLGAILLLSIIVVAVVCVLRSSRNKESESGDAKEVDVQMEDRVGSEDHEAESVLSEI